MLTFASQMQASNGQYMSKNDAARKELTSNNFSILDIGLHR